MNSHPVKHTRLEMQPLFFYIFFSFFFVSVFAWPPWSEETNLRIQNFSKEDIITTVVTGVNYFHFVGKNGPQYKFQGAAIPAGHVLTEIIKVNRFASNCPFTMIFYFRGGSTATFTINQKYALKAKPNFSSDGNRKIGYDKLGNTIIITVSDNGETVTATTPKVTDNSKTLTPTIPKVDSKTGTPTTTMETDDSRTVTLNTQEKSDVDVFPYPRCTLDDFLCQLVPKVKGSVCYSVV
ncbi:hypothetical protein Zmor_015145 [Zophobas morio]|uniref:Uncharacterized protein n=1 Tax=Zophobas morio TaxID=2755281 RepID=A0AA38IG65_9CUCU|nr:hypothetical protein Zmor_015145 [Zophobas morio]